MAAPFCIVLDNRTLGNTVTNIAEFEPYSFEPILDFSDSDGENTADGENELARRGNTSWCNCQHCENWENQQERECVCCQEIDEAMTKISSEMFLIKKIINFMKRFIHCFELVLVFSLMKNQPFVFNLVFLLSVLYDIDLEDDLPIRHISRHPTLISKLYVCEEKCWRRPLLV